ncbi:hypothetical protein [Streptomyces sp. NPDC085932]|uniref:hypothetical protein n=1 Tax=Streptomyces sp. NPDC085932 TaxID=3365741 RepID=UPI0037D16EBB
MFKQSTSGPKAASSRRGRALIAGLATAGALGSGIAMAPLALADSSNPPAAAGQSSPPAADGASQTPAAGEDVRPQGDSNGFHVYNVSGQLAKLESFKSGDVENGGATGKEGWENAENDLPEVGDVMKPAADANHWELPWRAARWGEGQLTYQMIDWASDKPAGKVIVNLHNNLVHQGWADCKSVKNDGKTENPDIQCKVDGDKIMIGDKPGTVIEIGDGKGQKQADVLRQLCDKNDVKCSFDATKKPVQFHLPTHQIGASVTNSSKKDGPSSRIEIKDVVSETNSLGIRLQTEAGLGKLVSMQFEESFGYQLTKQHEFTHSIDTPVPARTRVSVWATEPMLRATGTFTVKFGTTKWILHDVHFDNPDKNGNANFTIQYDKLPKDMPVTEGFVPPAEIAAATTPNS